MRIKLINSLSLPHPANEKRTVLHRGGEVLETGDQISAEIARRAVEMNAAQEVDANGDPVDDSGTDEDVELPARPNNGATKDTWRNYLAELNSATEGVLGPLVVPDNATRDDMIAIGDNRVAEWNALDEG
jgi:hypothetical protein